jgi:hypothetical protein
MPIFIPVHEYLVIEETHMHFEQTVFHAVHDKVLIWWLSNSRCCKVNLLVQAITVPLTNVSRKLLRCLKICNLSQYGADRA